jgi:hypothetical protein
VLIWSLRTTQQPIAAVPYIYKSQSHRADLVSSDCWAAKPPITLGLEWPAPLPPKRRVPGGCGVVFRRPDKGWQMPEGVGVARMAVTWVPSWRLWVGMAIAERGSVSVEDGQGAGSFRLHDWRDLWVSGATSWQSRLARGTVRRQQGRHADAAPGSAVAPVRHAVADAGIWLSRHRSQSISQL